MRRDVWKKEKETVVRWLNTASPGRTRLGSGYQPSFVYRPFNSILSNLSHPISSHPVIAGSITIDTPRTIQRHPHSLVQHPTSTSDLHHGARDINPLPNRNERYDHHTLHAFRPIFVHSHDLSRQTRYKASGAFYAFPMRVMSRINGRICTKHIPMRYRR